jgi:hypothetical protein
MKSWLLPAIDDPPESGGGPAYLRGTFPYVLPPLTRFEPPRSATASRAGLRTRRSRSATSTSSWRGSAAPAA